MTPSADAVERVLIMLRCELALPASERASCASTESLGIVLSGCEDALEALRRDRDALATALFRQLSRKVVDEWSLQAALTAKIVELADGRKA